MTQNITIEHIRYNQFLLFKRSGAFGRLILSCVKAEQIIDTEFNTTYDALFQRTHNKQIACKLIYLKNKDEWYIQSNDTNIEYKLITCTNNVAEVLKANDIITYYVDNEFYRFKVLKLFEKYNRITIEELSTHKHFNLSTILKRYNSEHISSITTYDSVINKN